MPRLRLPPTPASSTEIKGQDDAVLHLPAIHPAFELPPSAVAISEPQEQPPSTTHMAALIASTGKQTGSPVQASETLKSRLRSLATAPRDGFALPAPAPATRSRRTIQVKASGDGQTNEAGKAAARATATTAAQTLVAPAPAPLGPQKKKQAAATAAAGRKMARRTAHSLIERRRRSKMNDEFAVLRGLIPSCTGEMHKLAILQASIDYVRHLESCVSTLKTQIGSQRSSTAGPDGFVLPPMPTRRDYDGGTGDDAAVDTEAIGSEPVSPNWALTPARSHTASASPTLLAQDTRRTSHSSTFPDYGYYSYNACPARSLAPEAQQRHGGAVEPTSGSTSAVTSPDLGPLRDMDHEATTALLMLNADRRGMTGSGNGRGMSVKDLLST